MKSTEELLKIAVAALEDIKANDIRVMDVSKLTSLCHYMIVASADSTRQTKALANHVHEKVKAAGEPIHSIEGEQTGEWLLVDLGDIIVHIMQPAIRSYYDLEGLWSEQAWRSPQENSAVYG